MSPVKPLCAGFFPRFRPLVFLARYSTMPTKNQPDVAVEKEIMPGYDAKHFHPTNPGDALDGRYKVLAKLGWGASSTVWLAKETSR
ncbi:hypothetical protein QBC33DRAFT_562095 [Phialemonium atrogriseum]|uniref:Protein kinase domain-containing protein n=1 Tax=Phialemonium atrogriseum TaxID=1093897 RepID=A0AAJ0FI57_9PEZI|nr:uncharacterized protein QBC33DRAFT_562095 [Phialemonium atrogriseum]KAK1764038.1 hypothetical protein QBC33DRAFT_562095 [Phialemonium atrogriseum]